LTLGQWQYGVSPLPTLPGPSSTLASRSVGRLIDPRYQPPVSEEFNLGYSWALNSNSVIEVEYTHVLNLHENKTINIDQKVVTGTNPDGSPVLTRPLDAFTSDQFASVRVEESINRSRYDGLNFSYRRRMSNHFSLNANYTLAWAYGYDMGGGPDTIFRNYARDGYNPFSPVEWGPSTNDERHHVTISGLWDLPKGFQIAPILQFGSARPYNLTNSSNTIDTGGGTANAVVVPISDPTNYFAFAGNNVGAQTCYYSQQCTFSKYDPVRGDAFFQLDLRLAKNFKLGERMKLQLVAQAFNLTNRANYGNNFGRDISDPDSFGHPAGFINPSSSNTPRSLWSEFGVRFSF
jgi:hypothetical protein